MFRLLTLLLAGIVLSNCSGRISGLGGPHSAAQRAFLKNISTHCGQTYQGTVVFPAEPAPPFKDARLLMLVQQCGPTEWRIPFWVGEDKSRTWVLTPTGEGLLFKHDHRHEDGTPDEVTNYGGMADAAKFSRRCLHCRPHPRCCDECLAAPTERRRQNLQLHPRARRQAPFSG